MRLLDRRRSCISSFVSFIFFQLAVSVPALEIEKLVPFAWTNSVRIEAAFRTVEPVRDVDVTAEIRDCRETTLWSGKLRDISVPQNGTTSFSQTIGGLKPKLWSPTSPNLYHLTLTVHRGPKTLAVQSTRFGFRAFENRNGQFFLNDHPIFLRGVAINPPGRTIAQNVADTRVFAEAYVRYMKSQHVNAIRLPQHSQIWFDVCDELGMMLFQGNYSAPLASTTGKHAAPDDYDASLAAYKSLFETYARHPSILIYILANELPTSGARGKAFHNFLTHACNDLKQWDPTRLYIGNAGYGEGREGDVKDVHRYWGWYYNTFLTYYNLRDKALFGNPKLLQPLTFTECVGNYTGPRGDYNIIMSKQLGAQLNWTGHSPDQVHDALDYQTFMVKQATESFRRLRSQNPYLGGVMPFTIFFHNWSGITSFEQMKPKPALEQLRTSYRPILLSWEMWTPNVYAGRKITAYAHIVNDDDSFRDLENATLNAEIVDQDGRVVLDQQLKLPLIRYFKTWRKVIPFNLPETLPTGDYRITGRVVLRGEEISANATSLFIVNPKQSKPRVESSVVIFDPKGKTRSALHELGVPFTNLRHLTDLPMTNKALVIGEECLNAVKPEARLSLSKFVAAGGRVLLLRQNPRTFDPSWLPERIEFFTALANDTHYPPRRRPFVGNMNINPERPEHPVFVGLDRRRLAMWSDYTKWNQTKPGFPALYPVTAGFRLKSPEALARTAVLADYDRGLEGVALCEMFSGKGSFLVSAFDLVQRANLDPSADRLFLNLIRFIASDEAHDAYPLVDRPIHWGNYATERGLISGSLNGLLVNADWIVPSTNPKATPLTQDRGEWSTKPGDQFVPHGRLLAGRFGYSTSTGLVDLNSDELSSGMFFARIPPGRRAMRNLVENRSTAATKVHVFINGQLSGKGEVEPGKQATIIADLPFGANEVAVRYTGSKKVLLLESSFE